MTLNFATLTHCMLHFLIITYYIITNMYMMDKCSWELMCHVRFKIKNKQKNEEAKNKVDVLL